MAIPTNDSGLSLLGVVKWLLVICALGPLYFAYQGLVERRATVGESEIVYGGEAIRYGLQNLGLGLLLLGAAWAVWFFWQRYED